MIKSRITRNALVVGTVVLLAAGGVWAARAGRAEKSAMRGAAAGPLASVPAESMFCVRINDLDGTLGAVNEYLKGVAPESFDAQKAVLSRLGKLLGDEKLPGVNRKQNIALFGLNVPSQQAAPVGPMGNMFIGLMLPVKDYESFISQNPNCSKPDANGISIITVDGRARALVTEVRRAALLCQPNSRDKLIAVKNMVDRKKASLAVSLDAEQLEQSGSAPAWAYVNVKEASALIGPIFFAQLEQMKTQIQKMKESGQGPPMAIDPAGLVDLYKGMFKLAMDGTDCMTIALSPTPQACSLTVGVKAVPGTDMATMIGNPIGGDFGNMLGYLDDGAMMNLASKVDRASFKLVYTKLIDLVGKMAGGGMTQEDLDKVKAMTAKFTDALGDSLALSLTGTGRDSPAISAKYVIKVRDEAAFKQVIDEQLKMMQEGTFAKLYKGFGMEMDFKVQRGSDTYKGVTIDSAKAAFKMGDEKSPPTQMIRKLYGDALDYRWAFVKGQCIYAIGGGADKVIRGLIDQVQAGGPPATAVQKFESQISNAGLTVAQADAVGTFNYVRMLNMVMGAMPLPGAAEPVKLDVPTTSCVAFAGRTTAPGALSVQLVLPKQHLVEIQSAFKTLIPQIQKQHEMEKQGQEKKAEGV